MSTKIFVHKVLKVKPPKPPDPDLDRLFAEAVARREAEKTRREQNRRIMAELRNEELYKRAAKIPPPPPPARKPFCCSYCWGAETATVILGKDNKFLDRLWRGVVFHRQELLSGKWMESYQLCVALKLRQAARIAGHTLSTDDLASLAVFAINRSRETLEEMQAEREKREETLGKIIGGKVTTRLSQLDGPEKPRRCVQEEILR